VAFSTTSLLNTAGLSPNQYGLDVLLDLPNRSIFLGQGAPRLIQSYSIAEGSTLYAPLLSGRSATAIVRGSEPAALTYTAISGTAVSFTKRFTYDALQIGYATLNDMPPANLAAFLNGYKNLATRALANDVDSQVLGLYSTATNNVGGAGASFTISALASAIKFLEVANAPRPYYAVLPATQWAALAQTDELVRFDIRGEGNTIVNGTGFRYQGVDIFVTGNVPTSAGTAHGLVFSEAGIIATFRDLPGVKDWDEPNTASRKMALFLDWAYANSFADWIVDFQTTST
jgi:hypothetical protein